MFVVVESRQQIFTDHQGVFAVMEQRAARQLRLLGPGGLAQAGFQWAAQPVRAAEQVGAEGFVAKVAQSTPLTFETSLRDDGSGKHPGLAVAAQSDFRIHARCRAARPSRLASSAEGTPKPSVQTST